MSLLSIILPAYNEEENIKRVCRKLQEVCLSMQVMYELIFVDDGSTDQTWQEIMKMSEEDEHIIGIHFSRNFGKEAAVYAGLAQASGDAAAVMDCDLQHPPETLAEMYRLIQEGYEVIEGIKSSRGHESALRKKCTSVFYNFMTKATGVDMQNTSDFKMLSRKAVQAVLSLPERNMFFRATSTWVGFKTAYVKFEVQERQAGVSKWDTFSLIRYAFTNIVAFTTAPMQFVTIGGAFCLGFSIILTIYSLIMKFTGNAVSGYTTLLIVMLFIGSMVMISLGIIGYYIAKIYEEVKHRPRYIISSIVRKEDGVTDMLSGSEEISEK